MTDTRAPVATVAIRRESLGKLIKSRKLRVRATLDEPGAVGLTVNVAGHKLRSTLSFARAGGRTAVLKIGKSTVKALKERSRLRLTVTASAHDLAGNTTAAHGTRTLKR